MRLVLVLLQLPLVHVSSLAWIPTSHATSKGDPFRYVNNNSTGTFSIVEALSPLLDDTELLIDADATFTTGQVNSAGNTEHFIDTAIYADPMDSSCTDRLLVGKEIGTSGPQTVRL